MKTGRGSALIMVMLVVAGITTIVFATQRIALVQFSQSVREEDNLVATYAAQAGIEDGLSRYHFERNTETADGNVFRFNLTKAAYPNTENHEIEARTGIEEGVDRDYDPTHQYYDLAISYKTQRINVSEDGELAFPADGTSRIDRDDTLLLTGFPEAAEDYYLRYAFRFIENDPQGQCTDLSQAFVTLQQVALSTTSSGAESSSQVVARYSAGDYDSRTTANLQIHYVGASVVSSIRIRAYYCPVQFAFATTTSNDGFGSTRDFGPEFDSLTTDILSTGYYGSAKRTLIAKIDRQTGNLLGIFDYLLYAGGGGTTNTGNIERL